MTPRAPLGRLTALLSSLRPASASPRSAARGPRPGTFARAVLAGAFTLGAVPLGAAAPAALAQEPRREQDLSELEGRPAPALEVTGWMNTEGPLTWKDLRGKVVLLDFWGTW